MRPTASASLGLLLTLSGAPAFAFAQADQPVVFVHGLNANSSSWGSVPSNLATLLHIVSYTPTLPSTAYYETQRDSLIAYLSRNSISNSSILFGWSNGGIDARLVGGQQALAGLATYASPNRGAPIVDDVAYFASDVAGIVGSAALTAADFLYYAFHGPEDDSDVWAALEYAGVGTVTDAAYGYAYTIANQYGAGSAVGGSEMGPSTTFMTSTLPSAGESAHVSTRVGVTWETDDYYSGGMFKIATPTNADDWTSAWLFATGQAYFFAEYVAGLPDYGDGDIYEEHLVEAEDLYILADNMAYLDEDWCETVSGYGACLASDEVLPVYYQTYDGATASTNFGGAVVHTNEPLQQDEIGSVLQTYFNVTSR
ncbi:MAG TPA: alpha/beta hydrolase [Gemmatimonadaceae bacterium]|nr:alpha/beta hydrolase [Gemmatimonadaceae bacterium]